VELPRSAVADYLEEIGPSMCARYLLFLIEERSEVSPLFHDRLAELYLDMTLSARKQGDESTFLSSQSFRLTQLIGFERIMERFVLQASAIHQFDSLLQRRSFVRSPVLRR
jgi:hypothetical protein